MKKLALHWKIIIGMVLGVVLGLILSSAGLNQFTSDWIKPFGTIFIRLLKLIAVPLVLVSLINGITSMTDISKLSKMGSRTIGIYILTTFIAVSIGLVLVNIFKPGSGFSPETRQMFAEKFGSDTATRLATAESVSKQGPLQPLLDMIPSNIFESAGDNGAMLQVIFFAIIFGISMVMIDQKKVAPVKAFFQGVDAVILQMVNLIMEFAPYGVFALLASLIADFAGDDPASAIDLLGVLAKYSLVVVLGLAIMAFGVYPLMLKLIGRYDVGKFLKGIFPAQMMAFSTSSSAATLPVTMKQVENELGVHEDTASFVLPMGATINMDGTSLYQGVAAVFIAQVYGIDLTIMQQLGIVMTATLASIGAAAVPGAGIVMLIIVLEQAGLPVEGIALIMAPDRILDMCRTVVNVTGDASVCVMVEQMTGHPNEEQAATIAQKV
ncbi:dicarboxylate/amino acid:cation symporter [Limibacter armeniacum]|uniref:dicarboxylate/amino acid:cation symporter n=1 Tax=Limibacter armeniacum TaxID=466084 RepID=UPI002FE69352